MTREQLLIIIMKLKENSLLELLAHAKELAQWELQEESEYEERSV